MPAASPRSVAASLSPAQVRGLFEYNRRVFDRFVRKVRALPWRQATRSRGIGHESLFGTLVHILHVHEVWFGYIAQGKTSDKELQSLFSDAARKPKDWRSFAAFERRVWLVVDRYLARLTPAELRKPIQAFWMPGRYTVSDAVFQTTFEEAHHLGEVIGALWVDDLPPPEMTWIRVTRSSRARKA